MRLFLMGLHPLYIPLFLCFYVVDLELVVSFIIAQEQLVSSEIYGLSTYEMTVDLVN